MALYCRLLHWPGVGRYIRELAEALPRTAPDLDLHWLCDARGADELPRGRRIQALPVYSRAIGVCEQLELPWRLQRARIDLLHAPVSHNVPVAAPRLICTLHDLAVKHHPELLPSRTGRLYYGSMNRFALARARSVICVSRFTRDDAASLWPQWAQKLAVVPNGVSRCFRPVEDRRALDDARRALRLPERYLLYIGTWKRHKNLPRLLRAYGALDARWRSQFPLVLVSSPDPRYPEVNQSAREAEIEQNLLWRSGVPERHLPALYTMAHAVLLPSLFEGFGLPVAEGIACGTPALISDGGALAEVCQDAGLRCDPLRVSSIRDALMHLVADPSKHRELQLRARARARAFCWERAAARVAALYRAALQ